MTPISRKEANRALVLKWARTAQIDGHEDKAWALLLLWAELGGGKA
jgi:hypothetical protein